VIICTFLSMFVRISLISGPFKAVGTGFSFSDNEGSVNRATEAAEDMYDFFMALFQHPAFKKYATSRLIIAGESYAGHYLTALATHIILQNERRDTTRKILLESIIMVNRM
jgi:carboxypeptidase C (cathepsin A)